MDTHYMKKYDAFYITFCKEKMLSRISLIYAVLQQIHDQKIVSLTCELCSLQCIISSMAAEGQNKIITIRQLAI